MLAQRLALWLNRVIDAGRAAPGSASDSEEGAGEIDFDERPRTRKAALVEYAAAVGEIPDNGVVTAEQAESALGRTMATELDQDMLDALDPDTKEEEDALAGRQVNPPGVAYSCICWQPSAPDSVSAASVGRDEKLEKRLLSRSDFECTSTGMTKTCHAGLAAMSSSFKDELQRTKQQSELQAWVLPN